MKKLHTVFVFLLTLFWGNAYSNTDFGLDIINNATKNGKFDIDSKNPYFVYINENRVINICEKDQWAIRDKKFIGCKLPLTLNDYADRVLSGENRFVSIERFEYEKGEDYLILYLKVKYKENS